MEQENQFNEEQVKKEISDEVRAELNNMGYRILEADEVGSRDMCRLVGNFKNKLIEYDREVDRIKQRYSDEVAASKLNVLEADFRYDKESLAADVDKIIKEDQQRRVMEAEKLQADKEYKATRKECFEMLALLKNAGAEIPDDMFMGFVEPLVNAKDSKGLEVAKLLATTDTNQYICDKATQTITDYFNNQELQNFGQSAKEFINTGQAELTLSLYMAKHEAMLRGGK